MTATRFAVAAWGVCVVMAICTVILVVMGLGQSTPGDDFGLTGFGGLSWAVSSLAFATVGALVATRLPDNKVGWVFCVTGKAIGIGVLAYQYADQVLYGSLRGLPSGDLAATVQNIALAPAFGLLAIALLIFPDGRLPSRRWWPAVIPALAGSGSVAIGYALRPGMLDSPFDTVVNPLGVSGTLGLMNELSGLGWPMMGAGVALAAIAMRIRFRRATGLERQQLKWITLAAAICGLIIVSVFASWGLSVEGIDQLRLAADGVALSIFPIAAGVAILRYRLYDIDVVINRALVYGALTATLASIYLGSVLLLQLALDRLTEGSGLAVAASTLATAALVRPARARIQGMVDRRFFRRKYDAARILQAFGLRLRDQVDLDSLTTDLRNVVTDTMQPSHVTLWIPTPGGTR